MKGSAGQNGATHEAGTAWTPSPILARVLRIGGRISIALLAVGLLVALLSGQRGGSTLVAGDIAHALAHQHGVGIIGIGLVVLICTPICREVTAVVLFARHGERAFVMLGGIVLALIAFSLVVGTR